MTLLAFCGLVQREKIEAHVEHAKKVREAMRVNAAFAAPTELEREHRELLSELRRTTPRPQAPMTRDEAVRLTHEILTRAGFRRADPVS